MPTDAIATAWQRLVDAAAADPPPPVFDPETVSDLPEPARRFLLRVLPAATPLVSTVRLAMEGEIELGPRWFPFRADQILRAGTGFVWRPTVGGRILRFEGADLLTPDDARMAFRLHGRIPVVTASGPDVARSAAGRLAAETVVWLPQALAPQSGARWRSVDEGPDAGDRAVVTLDAAGTAVDVEVTVDGDGRLGAVALDRWNGSAKPPALQPFGGRLDDEWTTPDEVRIAGSGAVGWSWGTPAWPAGEFFRFRITDVDEPPRSTPPPRPPTR